MDPATHRATTRGLAKATSGRVLSVRYRLAPQHPFPAGLLDALLAYLYLLHPPPGAFHQSLPASEIILSGDSAGGGLAIALLQLLLQLKRSGEQFLFHGTSVNVELPAGVATNSGWLDITMSMDSIKKNVDYDYIPQGTDSPLHAYPPSSVWPTTPPRNCIYTPTTRAQLHPLASPVLAQSWEGSPPVLFMCGEERLTDESLFLAKRLVQDTKGNVGGGVWMFEAQCHCFSQVQPTSNVGRMAFDIWSEFCMDSVRKATSGRSADGLDPNGVKPLAKAVKPKTLKVEDFLVEEMIPLTMDELKQRMQVRVENMERRERQWIAEHQPKSLPNAKL
jgi:acetyl esterase/lipase